MSVHLPSSIPRTKMQQKKAEEKNNLLSVGVLKGFVMYKCICNPCMRFCDISITHMARCSKIDVSFKHLVVNFLYNSPIDANNLAL